MSNPLWLKWTWDQAGRGYAEALLTAVQAWVTDLWSRSEAGHSDHSGLLLLLLTAGSTDEYQVKSHSVHSFCFGFYWRVFNENLSKQKVLNTKNFWLKFCVVYFNPVCMPFQAEGVFLQLQLQAKQLCWLILLWTRADCCDAGFTCTLMTCQSRMVSTCQGQTVVSRSVRELHMILTTTTLHWPVIDSCCSLAAFCTFLSIMGAKSLKTDKSKQRFVGQSCETPFTALQFPLFWSPKSNLLSKVRHYNDLWLRVETHIEVLVEEEK